MRLLARCLAPLALLACSSPSGRAPAPASFLPEPPASETVLSSHWGGLLSGAQPRPAGVDPVESAAPWLVRCRFTWAGPDQADPALGTPIEPSAGLLIGLNQAQPLLAEATLLRRVRLLEAPPPAAFEFSRESAAVLLGATSGIGLRLDGADLLARIDVAAALEPGTPARMALVLSGRAPAPPPSAFGLEGVQTEGTPLQELVELKAAEGPTWLSIHVPELSGWLGIEAVVAPATQGAESKLLAAEARLRAESTATAVVAAAQPFDRTQFDRQQRLAALEALGRPTLMRAALLTLADGGGARLAGDLALAAEGDLLTELATALQKRLEAQPELLGSAGSVALESQRIGLESLTRWQSEGRLSAALEACLWLHGGELGRYPSTWLDLARSAQSVAELERAVAQENLSFLEDPSPAARVRAFDFLSQRGQAPAGFDPLADRVARRAALSKAFEPQAAQGGPR